MADLQLLQRKLGYKFSERKLLEQALSHRSVGAKNNERLEFLGDSIVNHIIAEALYRKFPAAREGELSRMRAALVKGETLAELAVELQLGEQLQLGSGELKSGGHRRPSILADAFEALMGAVLLDSDIEQCRRCIMGLFAARLDRITPDAAKKDAKTRLQEYLQARSVPLPEYRLDRVSGAEHNQRFYINCHVEKPALVIEGEGTSRRKAEQDAATRALRALNHGHD